MVDTALYVLKVYIKIFLLKIYKILCLGNFK